MVQLVNEASAVFFSYLFSLTEIVRSARGRKRKERDSFSHSSSPFLLLLLPNDPLPRPVTTFHSLSSLYIPSTSVSHLLTASLTAFLPVHFLIPLTRSRSTH